MQATPDSAAILACTLCAASAIGAMVAAGEMANKVPGVVAAEGAARGETGTIIAMMTRMES